MDGLLFLVHAPSPSIPLLNALTTADNDDALGVIEGGAQRGRVIEVAEVEDVGEVGAWYGQASF